MEQYQLTKTLRFGLTKVRKEKKHLSHEELDELVMISEYNLIKKNVLELAKNKEADNFDELDKRFEEIIKIEDKEQRNTEYAEFLNEFFRKENPVVVLNPEQTLFDSIKKIYDDIDNYIKAWEQVCTKTHLIKISKDYYKNLSKKAFYEIAKITTPEIPLSSLRGKNNYGVTVGKAISDYWLETIRKASFFFNDYFKSEFEEMGNALNDKSSSHKKKNLVDFRKSFLSLCSLVGDSLIPLVNGSILINSSSNEDDKKIVDDFITNESINKRAKLYDTIRDIKTLIKTEGGNTLLGRATLNPYTALQKPNLFSEKLKESAQDSDQEKRDKKDLNKFLKQLKQLLESKDFSVDNNIQLYNNLFTDNTDKKNQMNNNGLSAVQRAQYFKFKQIPASVRFILAKYLSEQCGYDFTEILTLFRIIGVPISPAEDYKHLKEAGKENEFSLDGYPLKVAFDYAWELCAKNMYEKVDFPQQECERFLKDNFGVDVANIDINENFNAKLHEVNLCIRSLSQTKKKKTLEDKWNAICSNLSSINNELQKATNDIKRQISFDFPTKSDESSKEWLNKNCKQSFDIITKTVGQMIKTTNNEFRWYSKLLWLNSCIVTLEHFNGKPPSDDVINKLKNMLNNIFFGENCVLSKEQSDNIAIIKKWIDAYQKQSDKKKWIDEKQWNTNDTIALYEEAKIFFGKQRGDQKTEFLKKTIVGDKDITEKFKDIAVEFGKNFAAIRDGLREEYELNKIQFGSVIIEDKNGDRYLLLQDKNVNKNENGEISHLDIFETESKGDLKLYQVKSLTSKTVKKIVASRKNYDTFFNGIAYPNKEDNKYKITYKVQDKDQYRQLKKEKEKQYEVDYKNSIVNSLTKSEFAIKEKLGEFKWNEALEQCQTPDQLYKTIDQKGYRFKPSLKNISYQQLKELIDNKGCFLLPIVNQDITAANKTNNQNQFTTDWNSIFDVNNKNYRLHPEFTLFYRLPTPNYPKPSEKRYSRFQVNCNFGLEVIPYDGEYTNKKEQLESFKTPSEQKKNVAKFNEGLSINAPYVIGIDRGINELATLCVTDFNGKIIGDFEIFKREFDAEAQCQKYISIGKRNILDLSNLRVERDAKGAFYLVDLSESKVWIDSLDHSKGQRDNNQIVKLKELYYTRQFVYHLQSNPDEIKREFYRLEKENDAFDSTNTNLDEHFTFKSELIVPYKCGNAFANYPFETVEGIIAKYNELKTEGKQDEIRKYYELDASYELKKGIVANMIGVVTYIFKEICHSNARIVLENLCTAWSIQNNALTGAILPSTLQNSSVDFKDQENSRLAGVGTYSMFEVQLLKKLFKLQIEKGANYVPAFRSVDDYEKAIQKLTTTTKSSKKPPTIYQFGIVCFVSPAGTSHKCPICGASRDKKIIRHKESNDELECTNCGYYSIVDKITRKSLYDNGHFINADIETFYESSNLKAIESGDDNAAYQIAVKGLKNFNADFFNEVQSLQNSLNKELDKDNEEPDVEEVSEQTTEKVSNPQKKVTNNWRNKQNNYSNKNRNHYRK